VRTTSTNQQAASWVISVMYKYRLKLLQRCPFEVIYAGSGRWAIHMQSKLNETADTMNERSQGFGAVQRL